jgi:predicted nucleotidyltransferase
VTLDDPVLAKVRRRLDEVYGDRLARAVLFGSPARGDHRSDSDYDVPVFLDARPDCWRELDRLAVMSNEILDENGAVFDLKPYSIQELWDRTPLMGEIRREGINIAEPPPP